VRCRKARWFLSARCDGTLSERQRARLEEHLETCAECRREAFYFSEIGSLVNRIERVPVRPDFDLRLKAAIRRAEATENEGRRWYQWHLTPAYRVAVGVCTVLVLFAASYGSYRVLGVDDTSAKLSTESALQNPSLATMPDGSVDTGSADSWSVPPPGLTPVDPMSADARILSTRYLAIDQQSGEYVLGTVRIDDPMAKNKEPNYVMPMVRSDHMVKKVSY